MARKFSKTYLAIVTPGAPEPKGGRIDQALRRDEQGREAYMRPCPPDHPDAERAVSRYRTLAEAPGAALLELDPETGRMHQLRVHLAHIGRPIAGDPRYGGALVIGGHAVPRLMLHATALSFPHPAGGTKRLEAPPPADMAGLIRDLGLG
jgi:tRNA pseudouridine32 synthase/23S rRNA pseudouridine746 synthase